MEKSDLKTVTVIRTGKKKFNFDSKGYSGNVDGSYIKSTMEETLADLFKHIARCFDIQLTVTVKIKEEEKIYPTKVTNDIPSRK